MNKHMEHPYPCIFCDHSTDWGSGRFVNRLPADTYYEFEDGTEEYRDGYACAECMATECDRCPELIGLDEDVTPDMVYGEGFGGLFSDKAHRVHAGCLTEKEAETWDKASN